MCCWPEAVIVNELYESFPNQAFLVTAMLSWPGLLTALASLLAGSLLQKLSTKKELIISGVSILFLALVPAAQNMIWVFCATMIGAIGAGFANMAGMSILSEVFLNENLRSKHMGYYNAAMALIGAGMSAAAGVLAVRQWADVFYMYWLAIPMLVMTVLFLPEIKPEDRDVNEEMSAGQGGGESKKEGYGRTFWLFFAAAFLFYLAYVPISSFLSIYVAENNLGGTSFVGMCASLSTVGSCLSCLLFGTLYVKLRRKLSLVYLLLDILLYLWAYLAPSSVSALGASIGTGITYGGIFSLCFAYGAEIVPPSKIGMTMGIMTFNGSVGIMLGVYLAEAAMNKMGTLTSTFMISLILFSVAFVMELAANIRSAGTPENKITE